MTTTTMDLGLACLAGADPPGAATLAAGAALLAIGAAAKRSLFEDVPVFWGEDARVGRVIIDVEAYVSGQSRRFAEDLGCPEAFWSPSSTVSFDEGPQVVRDMLLERGDPYGEILAHALDRQPWILAYSDTYGMAGRCCHPTPEQANLSRQDFAEQMGRRCYMNPSAVSRRPRRYGSICGAQYQQDEGATTQRPRWDRVFTSPVVPRPESEYLDDIDAGVPYRHWHRVHRTRAEMLWTPPTVLPPLKRD